MKLYKILFAAALIFSGYKMSAQNKHRISQEVIQTNNELSKYSKTGPIMIKRSDAYENVLITLSKHLPNPSRDIVYKNKEKGIIMANIITPVQNKSGDNYKNLFVKMSLEINIKAKVFSFIIKDLHKYDPASNDIDPIENIIERTNKAKEAIRTEKMTIRSAELLAEIISENENILNTS